MLMEEHMKILAITLFCSGMFLSGGLVYAQPPTDFEGNWSGRWENITFGSKDSAAMTVTLDTVLKTADVVLDLDGNVFGGSDPAPLLMTGPYTDSGFTVSGDAAPYGPITMTGGNGGMLTGRAPDVPNVSIDSVTMAGSYDAVSLALDYLVYFAMTGGTANGTITMEKQTAVDVDEGTATVPYRFVLHQNYPNPFNPSTVIAYNLPWEAAVTLRIFDVSGSLVENLDRGVTAPGSYSVEWLPDGLAAGVYYYRLDALATSHPRRTHSRTRGLIYLK